MPDSDARRRDFLDEMNHRVEVFDLLCERHFVKPIEETEIHVG